MEVNLREGVKVARMLFLLYLQWNPEINIKHLSTYLPLKNNSASVYLGQKPSIILNDFTVTSNLSALIPLSHDF